MIILSSILNANNLSPSRDVEKATQAGIARFHIGIMDGHFVLNLSHGPQPVWDFKCESPLVEAEARLMSNNLGTAISVFTQTGADLLESHLEAANKVGYWLDHLVSNGVETGLVLDPETDVASLRPCLRKLKQALLMNVHPSFSGQKYIPEIAGKVAQLKQLTNETDVDILTEVDGGIDDKIVPLTTRARTDVLICESYIFKNGDIASRIRRLEGTLNEGY